MNQTLADLEKKLLATLEDGRISRSERRALAACLVDASLDDPGRVHLRKRAIELSAQRLKRPHNTEPLAWLDDVLDLLDTTRPPHGAPKRFSARVAPASKHCCASLPPQKAVSIAVSSPSPTMNYLTPWPRRSPEAYACDCSRTTSNQGTLAQM